MGRDRKNENRREHFTAMFRSTLETPAWRALSTTAQALYPWIKLEWRGPKANNNGKLRLSVRQASQKMGVSNNTAARAFHDLQAKGFLVVTEPARLGMSGDAKAPAFELTEIGRLGTDKPSGSKLYNEWRDGADFPILKTIANNPLGTNGKTKSCHQNEDNNVIKMKTIK